MAFLRSLSLFLVATFLTCVRGAACPDPPADICNVSAPTERPGAAHCGDRGTASPRASQVLRNECFASFAPCRNACLTNSKCAAFSTSTPSGGCVLYSEGPEAIGFTAKASSALRFYNRRCFTFDRGAGCVTTPPGPEPLVDFYLQVMNSTVSGSAFLRPAQNGDQYGDKVKIGGAVGRSTFTFVNKDAATGVGNVVIKGSNPAVYVAAAANSANNYVFLSTEAQFASNFVKLECSNSANGQSFTCTNGPNDMFADTPTEVSPDTLVIFTPRYNPSGVEGSRTVTLKAVPVP